MNEELAKLVAQAAAANTFEKLRTEGRVADDDSVFIRLITDAANEAPANLAKYAAQLNEPFVTATFKVDAKWLVPGYVTVTAAAWRVPGGIVAKARLYNHDTTIVFRHEIGAPGTIFGAGPLAECRTGALMQWYAGELSAIEYTPISVEDVLLNDDCKNALRSAARAMLTWIWPGGSS